MCCGRGIWGGAARDAMASPPSDHDTDNSVCDCSMCGRGVWPPEFHSAEDELDAYINAKEAENRRLLVRERWLQDRLAQMSEDLESARADLARAQADLADLARAQAAPKGASKGASKKAIGTVPPFDHDANVRSRSRSRSRRTESCESHRDTQEALQVVLNACSEASEVCQQAAKIAYKAATAFDQQNRTIDDFIVLVERRRQHID